MKNIILIISLVIVCACARAQNQQEEAILELSKKKFQWMINMKYDSLESVLDDRFIFVHSNGWSETKTEFIHDIQSNKLRYNVIEVLEASARVYSGSAIIIGRGKFNVTLDGKILALELKYTEFYIQKNGKWLLVSRHANRLQ